MDIKAIQAQVNAVTESFKGKSKVEIANKIKANEPGWKDAMREGMKAYIESDDYVNPRGMLGKHHTQETKDTLSELHQGRTKTLEHNEKVSEWRKENINHTKETRDKISQALTGKTHNRCKSVVTPHGVFDKIKHACEFYGVTDGALKNWLNKRITGITNKRILQNLTDKGVEFDENNFPQGFSWGESNEDWQKGRKVLAEGRTFDNIQDAAEHYNITPQAMRHRCITDGNKDFRFKK